MKKSVKITITGLVQGVFFRENAKRTTDGLKLSGWVRNEKDGTVTILAEGEKNKLLEFIEWCKKGTKESRVDKVEIEWGNAIEGLKGFEIRSW